MATSPWTLLLPLALVALLTGCAATPPSKPDTAALQATAFDGAPSAAAWAEAPWWATLGDPTLDALLARTSEQAHDVRIAAERVREARAGLRQAASRLQPTLALTGSASDQRSGLPASVKQGSPDTRALRAALELGWEIDFAGAAAAGADATAFDAAAAEGGLIAARWSVQHELARQYLVWQGARLRLQTLERLIELQQDTERLTASREAAGEASRFDLARARGETRALAAQLPPLQALATVTAQHIAVLAGLPPARAADLLDERAPPQLPAAADMPVGQPVDLLRRRPDLRVAEARLHAESARLRAADAELWPKFFLAAVLGRQDLRLNGLDLATVGFRSAALAFSLPLFNAGRLQAAVEAQSARQRAATLRYEQAALQALQEVEASLVALARERERSEATAAALHERRTALQHARSLQREGQIDLLAVLDVQRGVLAAELADIDSRVQAALNTARLFQALGGGWPGSTEMPTAGEAAMPAPIAVAAAATHAAVLRTSVSAPPAPPAIDRPAGGSTVPRPHGMPAPPTAP